ncbi:MAG: UDP-N-acetylmuramoyl-L-alanine--D-glutamate ligase [Lachnospiraceae bacterium]|nr:UDP-N-acetylmuramoyl-L-alanine--D-glutamate ligase [Lachnospiraceae bacterium]
MAKVIDKFQNKNILIWGYGREGKSTEAFFRKICPGAQLTVFEGKREEIREEDYDYIIKSPGIRMDEEHPKFTSQTEIFLEEYRDRVIGITGTKGKSTTSSMLYQVLQENSGKKVILMGNIGLPCLDYFSEMDEDTIVVFEMSCHQLAHTKVSPHVAVFLNLYEEHLDYYDTLERYFLAKSNIGRYQKEGDFFLVGENVPEIPCEGQVTVLPYDFSSRYELQILGDHNQYNADIVYRIATQVYGCDGAKVRESMARFQGLPHRLQFVGQVEGVRYYDDSISTIPEAAIHAVQSIPKVGSMIIGGMDRGVDYTILQDFIKSTPSVRFICAYEAGKRIWESVKQCENVFFVDDLAMAVKLAGELTGAGEACVLSPAAASYGYFKNFEERGDVFQKLVNMSGTSAIV